jgi:hypothetical protein
MAECKHPELIKQSGPMDGGENSKRYRCKACNKFLMVTLKSADIGVEFGDKSREPKKGGVDG